MSDCRCMIRAKWVDVDIAKSMFPKRGGNIEQAAIESDRFLLDAAHGYDAMDSMEIADGVYRSDRQDFAYNRPRVRLIELWRRAPVNVGKLVGGGFGGQVFDEDHAGHREAVEPGHSVVVNQGDDADARRDSDREGLAVRLADALSPQ